jgi:hypothetical protein
MSLITEFASHKLNENEKARKIEEEKELERLKKEQEAERLAAEEAEMKLCEQEGREYVPPRPPPIEVAASSARESVTSPAASRKKFI